MIRPLTTRGAVAAISLSFLLSSLLLPSPLRADETPKPEEPDAEERLKELEQKVDVLTKEIESLRLGETAPAGRRRRGRAADARTRAVSLEGLREERRLDRRVRRDPVPELLGTRQDGSPSNLTPTIDVARAVLYFGYKFDDHFVFNSEIEYEHAVAARRTRKARSRSSSRTSTGSAASAPSTLARGPRAHPGRPHQPAPRAARLPRRAPAGRRDRDPSVDVARDRHRRVGRRRVRSRTAFTS